MFRHHWHHNRRSHMMEDMMGSKLGMALTAGALVYLGSKLIRRLKYH